jgi:hypothetical protein
MKSTRWLNSRQESHLWKKRGKITLHVVFTKSAGVWTAYASYRPSENAIMEYKPWRIAYKSRKAAMAAAERCADQLQKIVKEVSK